MAVTGTPLESQWRLRLGAALRLAAVYLDLAKARLTAMVAATAGVGYVLATEEAAGWDRLAWLVLGTLLAAGGANGLNQCYEVTADGRMARTRQRPLVRQCLGVGRARVICATWAVLGVAILSALVNFVTAALAAGNVLLYVFVYTPLKRRSSACTLIGAVVGAVPPLMGATAATGRVGPGAWILAAILFIWQVPHSLALAWLHREDYARGGYRLLVWGAQRRLALEMIMLYSLALLPVSLAPSLVHRAGAFYAIGAILLGMTVQVLALQLHRTGERVWARRLFVATIVYLPALLGLMLIDARAR